jgi:HEAT repeat protein
MPVAKLLGLARSTSDVWLKTDVIEELATRKAFEAVPVIAGLLEDVDRDVRRVAADALAELGDGRALPALRNALRTERDARVRPGLLKAIEELRER